MCSILHALEVFLDRVPLHNGTAMTTFTRNNFGIVAMNTTELDSQLLAFGANLGPVETAVSDNKTISPEQLLVGSGALSGDTTGEISLGELDTSCPLNGENERVAYSVFRTDALFLTPETACQQFAVGSIILGVRKSGGKDCETGSVIVDLQQLNEVNFECIAMRELPCVAGLRRDWHHRI